MVAFGRVGGVVWNVRERKRSCAPGRCRWAGTLRAAGIIQHQGQRTASTTAREYCSSDISYMPKHLGEEVLTSFL